MTDHSVQSADKPFSSLAPAIIGSALLMQNLNATVLANALPTMARSLHENPVHLSSAISVYLLASAVFLPISGWAADTFGGKRLFMLAIGAYAIACAACGFAQNLPEVLLARFCQGAAGAVMAPVGRLVLLRTTPKHDLVRAISVLTMPALIGPMIGPLIGGLIVTYGSWRWIFFLNLPIAAVGLMLVGRFIEDVAEQEVAPLDWVGFALSGLGLASVVFGFESLGHDSLSAAAMTGLFVFGAVCLAAYAWRAPRSANPIVDLSLLKLPTFLASVGGGAFVRFGAGALPFLLALFLQGPLGLSPIQAGMMTFVSAAGALVMKSCAPPILARFGFKRALCANAALVGASFMSYAVFERRTPELLIYSLLLVGGFFRSLTFTALNGIAFADVEQSQMSRASTLSTMGQQLAQSIGVGLAASLLQILGGHAGAGPVSIGALSLTFVIIGLITCLSAPCFLLLPEDAGAQLHAPRRRVAEGCAADEATPVKAVSR